jgi:CheY-like chemotaxis protein
LSAAPQHDRLAALLAAMRAFRAGDTDVRAPRDAAPGESAIVAELCTLFDAIADHTQALEQEVARLRGESAPELNDPADAASVTDSSADSADSATESSANAESSRDTAADSDVELPVIPIEPDRDGAPAILVVEADSGSENDPDDPGPGADSPMRDAAQTALRGLGGVWDQAAVVRVDSAASVHDAAARHRVVSALIDARGPLDLLNSVLDALDAAVPGVPLLCFAPDGDPTAYDQATVVTRGRTRAEVVRSSTQAVERLTLHWLTQAPVAPDPLAEPADSGYGQIRFEGEKVLVVDDDVRNVFAMVSALELYGLTALTADNGPEGIELLVRNPDIGVVLMDLMMPGLDGYATTARIRSYPEFADLPIIAVTARAAPGDRDRSLAAGTNEHVTKPVEIDQLLALIRRLIKRT